MAGVFDLFDAAPMIMAPPSVPPRLMDLPENANRVRRMKRGGFQDQDIERILIEEGGEASGPAAPAARTPQLPSEAATRAPGVPGFSSPWAEQAGGSGGFDDFVKMLTSIGPMMPTGLPAEPRMTNASGHGAASMGLPPAGGAPPIPDMFGMGPEGVPPGMPPPPVPGRKPPGIEAFLAEIMGPGRGPNMRGAPNASGMPQGMMGQPPGPIPGEFTPPVPFQTPESVAGVPGGPGAAPPDERNFMDKILDPDNRNTLMEMGLRLMAAAQPKPGTTVGPSTIGAIGEAGLGTLKESSRRRSASAESALEREKLDIKRDEVEATRELRRETLRLKTQADTLANQLRLQSFQLDKISLAASITDGERKALDDLRDSISYLGASEAEQKRNEQEIKDRYDRMRRDLAGGGTEAPGAKSAAASEPEATRTVNGKTYVKVGGQWYEK